jgi:hypothetical protein
MILHDGVDAFEGKYIKGCALYRIYYSAYGVSRKDDTTLQDSTPSSLDKKVCEKSM